MPVVLPERAYDTWLAADTDSDRLRQLLVPAADDDWITTPVSTFVNKPANQGAECIEAVS